MGPPPRAPQQQQKTRRPGRVAPSLEHPHQHLHRHLRGRPGPQGRGAVSRLPPAGQLLRIRGHGQHGENLGFGHPEDTAGRCGVVHAAAQGRPATLPRLEPASTDLRCAATALIRAPACSTPDQGTAAASTDSGGAADTGNASADATLVQRRRALQTLYEQFPVFSSSKVRATACGVLSSGPRSHPTLSIADA